MRAPPPRKEQRLASSGKTKGPLSRPSAVRSNSSAKTAELIHFTSSPLGAAPTFWAASLPSLNSISVGIDRMPSLPATPGFSSTLTLAILTLPCISVAISSSEGPIILQGPHHSAQKSTTTGSEDLRTSASKLASVTFEVAITASWGRGDFRASGTEPRNAL